MDQNIILTNFFSIFYNIHIMSFTLVKHTNNKITDETIKEQVALGIPQKGTYPRPIPLGVSGSNNSDLTRVNSYCVTGTLGFLIEDSLRRQYIVSNAHVLVGFDPRLTAINRTSVGDRIIQPGDVDSGCTPNKISSAVANLTKWTSINPRTSANEIDVAIARTIKGKVNASGFIANLGLVRETIPNTAIPIRVRKSVRKSGRTTGITQGRVAFVNVRVQVEYQTPGGIPFIVTFNNVFFVHGVGFSAPGDSGSLIYANDASRSPMGLLFAGGGNFTVAFPINRVLRRIQELLRRNVKIKGYFAPETRPRARSLEINSQVEKEITIPEKLDCAKDELHKKLCHVDGYIGVGMKENENTKDIDDELVVFINKDCNIPNEFNGVKIDVVRLNEKIIAY